MIEAEEEDEVEAVVWAAVLLEEVGEGVELREVAEEEEGHEAERNTSSSVCHMAWSPALIESRNRIGTLESSWHGEATTTCC